MSMSQKRWHMLLVIFVLFGILLRGYNLNWGAPFYFHPDERNIASSVSQLQFPTQLNPHFFAYGTFPIYTTYAVAVVINSVTIIVRGVLTHTPIVSTSFFTIPFETAIIASRVISFVLSCLVLVVIYKIGFSIGGKKTAVMSLILSVCSVGFIQFAHFGTFEMWLTLLTLLLFGSCLQLLKDQHPLYVFQTGLITGLLLATKISSLALIPLPLLTLCWVLVKHKTVIRDIGKILLFLSITGATFCVLSPYVFLDKTSFAASMQYESSVAFGTLAVFYTGGFTGTTPVIYQFIHVYPFLINPFLTILLPVMFFVILYHAIRERKTNLFLLLIFFLITFLSQAFLFVKWTRYMMPTLPYIYLMFGIVLSRNVRAYKRVKLFTVSFLCILSFLFAVLYVYGAFVSEDTRLVASDWARTHISKNANILSEVYDLGIVPFNDRFRSITLYNFYDIENQKLPAQQVEDIISVYDYIVLPSQRILKTRLEHTDAFPQGNKVYHDLLLGKLGFIKIYQTPCPIWCRIVYLGDPIAHLEETTSVFDRPVVIILKKI